MNFDITENFGDTATGILSLPGHMAPPGSSMGSTAFMVMHMQDGRRMRINPSCPFSAYENMPIRDEIQMFVDINTQQVKVSATS